MSRRSAVRSPAAWMSLALQRLSGRLGLLLMLVALGAYIVLALAPFRWVPPRRLVNGGATGPAGLVFGEPGLARTQGPPAWLDDAIARGTLRLDLRLRTYDPDAPEMGRIFSVSRDYHFRNLSLDQEGPDLVLRLRRPGSTPNGKPSYRLAGVLDDTGWHDVQVSIAPGRLHVVVDGRPALTRPLPEHPLANWDRGYPVVLGNERNGGLPWRGEIARAVVAVGAEGADYARPGALDVPRHFWALGNRPTWLFEDYVYPDSIEDWLANFVAFIPVGFLAVALAGERGSGRRALVICAAISLLVEVAQGFFSRHPATVDLVLNTLGGGAGGAAARFLLDRLPRRPACEAPRWTGPWRHGA